MFFKAALLSLDKLGASSGLRLSCNVIDITRIMKILIHILFTLSFLITIVTCDSETTSPSDNINYYSVSGTVFDVVSSDYSPGLKKDAPVYIDNDSTISGSDGRFLFNKISEGSHTISVTLPNYDPFSRTINISKDTTIAIYLYGKKEDYFPIEGNSLIKFKYSSSSSNGISSVSDNGEAVWTINPPKQVDDSKVYEVVETIIYTRKIYSPIYSEMLDTSSTSFTITVNNSNVVSFNSSVLDGVSFNRYLDPRQEQDGVIVKSYNNPGSLISTVNVSLKKDIGLYKIVQFGNRWSKKYELNK